MNTDHSPCRNPSSGGSADHTENIPPVYNRAASGEGEDADLALLQVNVREVSVPALFSGDVRSVRGERAMVLGFPTGLNAILARTEGLSAST